MRVVTANVNGIRASARRGGLDWLRAQRADVITLQEVRADDDGLRKTLADAGFGDWHLAHSPSSARRGHSGVAVLSRAAMTEIRFLPDADFAAQGRYVEADLATASGPLTVASAYVHTGEADTVRQDEKYAFLVALERRLEEWTRDRRLAALTGDLNIARSEDDLKNWKGNLGKAGFLDDERALLDRWCSGPLVDVHRTLAGPGPGPYTWWSWRGRAFDNDTGWRIDYQLATPPLAALAREAVVGRAATYAERWSDHAPVVVDYDIDGVSATGVRP
ncbi:exodeoxyribonuclease III [Nostocoides sp. F2B08]|uniref:exodeoxyribonuclease III n=1 Tax=Nostocoides sp. F2B08 TaxID=2653936 RepID=UPI0012634789|nr:exodeoxyribonuclease III [Tetrasphaera sp. F2B08]KAB7746308.1 exodeoxyribonuclease III [Tetrasphaera sp. F2B08]